MMILYTWCLIIVHAMVLGAALQEEDYEKIASSLVKTALYLPLFLRALGVV